MAQLAVLLGLYAVSGSLIESSQDLEARWRREYPRAAEEWEALARDFLARGSFSFRWGIGDTTTTEALTVAASGDKRLFIRDRRSTESPKGPTRLDETDGYCETPDYMFDIAKPQQSDKYILRSYEPYQEDDESRFHYYFKNFARNATVYYGIPFVKRMQDPSFVLKSIEPIEHDGHKLVRIAYDYEGKYSYETGTVDLEPDRNWAIRTVDIHLKNKKILPPHDLKIQVGYVQVNATQSFPNRMESFLTTDKPEVYEHATLQLDEITLGNVPDSIFRLSAYGLPDVPLRPSPRASVFTVRNPVLWLTGAAALASFALMWYLRPRRAQPA